MYRRIRALAALILAAILSATGYTLALSKRADAQNDPRVQAGFSAQLDHFDSRDAYINWSGSQPPLGSTKIPPVPTGVFDVVQDGTTIVSKSNLSGIALVGTVAVPVAQVTSHTISLVYEGDDHYLPWASSPMTRDPFVPLSINWLAGNPKTSNYKPALVASLNATPQTNLSNLNIALMIDGVIHSTEQSFASNPLTGGSPGVIFPYEDLLPGTHTYQAVFNSKSQIFLNTASTTIAIDIPSTPPLQSTFAGTSYRFDELSTDPGPVSFSKAPYIKFHVTALNGAHSAVGMQASIFVDRAPAGYTVVDNDSNVQFWSGAGYVDTHTYSILVGDTMSQQISRTFTQGNAFITSHLETAGTTNKVSWTHATGESPCCSFLPTGVISVVADRSTVLASFPANNDGSFALTNAQITNHYVQVVYSGDSNYSPFSSSPYAKTPYLAVTAGWKSPSLTAFDGDVALVAKFDAGDLTPTLTGWASLIVDGHPVGVFMPVIIEGDGHASATFAGSGPDNHTIGSRGDIAGPILWGNHAYQVAYTPDYPNPGPAYLSQKLAFAATTSGAIDINYEPNGATTATTIVSAPTTSTSALTKLNIAPTTTTPPNERAAANTSQGYRIITNTGSVSTHGEAHSYGQLENAPNTPIIASASSPSGNGYWMTSSDGGVFAFGDAAFYGSMAGQHLNQKIVGIAPTKTGQGYWLISSDGGIFSFGDATFLGSMGGRQLNQPIVGIAATPTGNGYWMVASDGGVFAFGDAQFFGSMGAQPLNKPIVGIATTVNGNGYWFVASDGGIFSFGNASFYGSAGSVQLNQPITAMKATPDGHGYWFVAADGGIFNYGNATFYGSEAGAISSPVAGLA